MASGDAQRVWFPEMIEHLRAHWLQHRSASPYPLETLIELRDELDAMLQHIRSSRNIRPPVHTCPRCGERGPGADPHVSVRAAILSLGRFHIATPEQTSALEKAWAQMRNQNALDGDGEPAGSQPARSQAIPRDNCHSTVPVLG